MSSKLLRESVGLNAVERIFLEDFQWFFRSQPVADWGIDAHVEVVENNVPTGKLIALQIKSGPSYFRRSGDDYVFYGERRHYDYWTGHSLPVFLILHNPDNGLTLWQKIEPHLITHGDDGPWSVRIPPTNVLSSRSKRNFEDGIANDEVSYRRFLITLHLPTIRLFSEHDAVYLVVEQWVNKSLNMRNVDVYFDDPDKDEPDLVIERWLPHSNLEHYMAVRLPWLDYEAYEEADDSSGEVMAHYLNVTVNELGRSALVMEAFYQDGAEVKGPAEDHGEYLPVDDDFDEEAYRRAVERDVS